MLVAYPDVSPFLDRIEFLKSRLASAPVVGSPGRTAILLEIIKIQKQVLAIREFDQDSKTTPLRKERHMLVLYALMLTSFVVGMLFYRDISRLVRIHVDRKQGISRGQIM